MENLRLNVALLRKKVPNLTSAAKTVGLRPATVSNLCTGKIPVGRAEVKTLVALANLAECRLDDLIIQDEKTEMVETGIKTLDLLAPLAKDGTVGLVARPGLGQVAVLDEVFFRLKQQNYSTVLLMPEGEHPELSDLMEDVDRVVHGISEAFDVVGKALREENVAFAADRSHVVSGEILDLQDRLQKEGVHNVTTFLVDLKGESVDEDLPYGPLETLWQFDVDLAVRQKYPCINPVYSTSSILEGAFLDQNHITIQQRAVKLLRRYRELRSLVNVSGEEMLPDSEVTTYKRGERLEAYLTQSFYIAEKYTGTKGEYVSLQETLEDVRKILEGSTDSIAVDQLNFIGKME
jgi:F-type H+/Na+-transporting ATPase subunit beta